MGRRNAHDLAGKQWDDILTALLSEFGKKLADKWLSAILLPGLLLIAALWCAHNLGNAHAVDQKLLVSRLRWTSNFLRSDPAELAAGIVLVLLTAFLSGIVAEAIAGLVNRIWTSRHPQFLIRHRKRRAIRASQHRNLRMLTRDLPERLTSAGDRFRLVGERVEAQYGLDVILIWPRLWLLVSADTRGELQLAFERYQDATRLVGWSFLFLLTGAWWWPAAAIGGIGIGMGHQRGLKTSVILSDLIEATVDLNHKALAESLSIALPSHGRFTPDEGSQINNILNKHSALGGR